MNNKECCCNQLALGPQKDQHHGGEWKGGGGDGGEAEESRKLEKFQSEEETILRLNCNSAVFPGRVEVKLWIKTFTFKTKEHVSPAAFPTRVLDKDHLMC